VKSSSFQFFGLLFFFILVFEVNAGGNSTHFSGVIKNIKPGTEVQISTYNLILDDFQRLYKAKVSGLGKFEFSINLSKPLYADLFVGNESIPIFICPGDSIYLISEYEELEDAGVYSGKGSLESQFLLDEYKRVGPDYLSRKINEAIIKLDTTDFYPFIDTLTIQRMANLKSGNDKRSLRPDFIHLKQMEYKCNEISSKLNYLSEWPYFHRSKRNLILSDSSFFQNFDFNDESLTGYEFYEEAIQSILFYKGYQQLTVNRQANFRELNFGLIDKYLTGKVKAWFLAIAISEEFENMELAEPKYRIWMQENSDSEFAQFLKKQYLNHQKTRKGKPAPKLALKDRNGKLIALSDFLGKVVYLEFWASWCGPCIMEAPNFKKLYSSFAPKGVVFLSVSIDENENLWLKMLDKLKIPGFHVRAKGRTDSNILNYSVNGIPRYFCIGKNGEIVDSNAPSPSQLEIGTLLDSELKK